jgi:hypothetical protein
MIRGPAGVVEKPTATDLTGVSATLRLQELLADIEVCDEQIEALNSEIAGRLVQEAEILERLGYHASLQPTS